MKKIGSVAAIVALILAEFFLLPLTAFAADYVIAFKDGQFSPKELIVPAGEKIKITVKNAATAPIEFESTDLNREKVVAGNAIAVLTVGPLDAGTYTYFNDFNRDTTATITAK